ncbi:MAG TPA: hypothetical protein VKA15_02765 [Isosphaeraceae bacterium]|nr:hypothetical protein [Isosphaeraceae bacterium]
MRKPWAAGGLPIVPDSSTPTGDFFHNDQQFNYTTPDGTHVELKIIGRGSLQGTTVDSSGALHLLFSKTNAFTKITSNVHGGTGQADLASIYNADLFLNHAVTSLSGIGAPVLDTINLGKFNLIAGGTIDVTSGIDNLNLNSVGPDTQIQLRQLPSTVTAGTSTTASTSSSSSNVIVSDAFLVQSLAGINGEFFSAGNIIEVPTAGAPGPPPAPPGIVLKINHINGNIASAPNLLTDNDIYGYDPMTGQVVRFNLTPATNATTGQPDMSKQTGPLDPTFTPLQVEQAGSTTPVAISVGHDGNRLALLVSTGSRISVYDATYGTPLGSFTTPPGFDANALGSTDTLTVMGDVATNQLQEIDIPLNLAAGTAQLPVNEPGYPPPANYPPPAGLSLVGGLTGLVGTNQVYPTVAAYPNTLQPTVTQLGLLTAGTSVADTNPSGGLVLVRQFTTVSQKAIQSDGAYIPVSRPSNPFLLTPLWTGVPEGSVDSSLALNTIEGTPGQYTNTVSLLGPVSLTQRGTITLNTTDPITDLSESFRPELNGSAAAGTGPALIDVQGNIQSLRGLTANGLVLNDTGYINLIRTGQISTSTILAQPIGHINTPPAQRTNDVLLISTDNRDFGKRGGVNTLVSNLYQIGPLSLTNNSPNP